MYYTLVVDQASTQNQLKLYKTVSIPKVWSNRKETAQPYTSYMTVGRASFILDYITWIIFIWSIN